MKTENLTKTNLQTTANIYEIEQFLNAEITSIYTFKPDFKGFSINPGSVIFKNNYPCSGFKPFTMINRDYQFNHETGILILSGRNKWKRVMKIKKYQLEKVGYKLPTTHLSEGWIWGNPVEIE